MFLTQLRLDSRNAQARRDLANPYDLHRTLVRAFVQNELSLPPRILWRLEPGKVWDRPTLLVQSTEPGVWDYLTSVQGYLHEPDAISVKALPLEHLLAPGAVYRFRLVANPTVTRQGKRQGLVGEVDQLAWLERQATLHGFKVQTSLVMSSDLLRGHKTGHSISLLQVHFEGLLVADDVAKLAQALSQGIGHGKAFGCGLLSLARCS